MRKTLLFVVAGMSALHASAQLEKTEDIKKNLAAESKDTVAWVHGGIVNVGLNEGFLHNWSAGGEVASMTINGVVNGYLNRIVHQHIWTNNLDINYGLFYAYSNNFVPRKTDDRVDFTSKYGVRLNKESHLYLTGLFNFKSQFTKGFDYSIPHFDSIATSEFLSPAYFTAAVGLDYRKGNDLSLFLSPLAARITLVKLDYTNRNPEGAFGVEHGKKSRVELGAYFSGRYQVEVNRKMLFKTRLDLYANYLAKDRKDSLGVVVKKDNPGNVDLLWDNYFSWKMSKYLSVSLGATLIYDNDVPYSKTYIDPATGLVKEKDEPGTGLGWLQLKQLFTIGFEYRF